MYQPLAPCPACSRHVKTTERTCPFCRGTLPDSIADAALPGAPSRMARAAAFAFTASLAVTGAVAASTTGCTSGVSAPIGGDAAAKDGSSPNDDGGNQPIYGAPAYGEPPVDAGPDDSGGAGTKYGGPPIDSGAD
jgi:hypothetical protein